MTMEKNTTEKSAGAMAADEVLKAFGIDEHGNDVAEQVNISEVDPNPDHNRIPDPFEAPIQGFSFSRAEIEDYIRKHLVDAMKEMGLSMRDMAVRGGIEAAPAHDNSNGKHLEAVFEFDDLGRSIYEDEVLQYLDKFHPLAIEGVRVRFHPLNDKQSGTLDDYWKNFIARNEIEDKARKQFKAQQEQYNALHDDDIPEPPPPKTDNPNDTRNLDYQSKIDVDVYQDYADPEAARRSSNGGMGVPFSRDEITQIAAALGTTNDIKQGGWILPDGRLLRFIKDGIRRKEQDIGIGYTEERKHRIANEIKKMRENLNPSEHKDDTTGPYDINGYAQSQPVDPWGSIAEKQFPEAYPLEAVKGGLIRYAISPEGDAVEIDAYKQPTQGQMDVLEEIYEWVKFLNEGGYNKKHDTAEAPEPTVQSNAELTFTQEQPPQQPASPMLSNALPTAADSMIDEDNYEKHRRERQEHADEKYKSANRRFNSNLPDVKEEDVPQSMMTIVYVGTGPEDWWDYDTVEDVQRNLVKDLRAYWRDGKKPNEDFNLPEDYEDDEIDAHGDGPQVAKDEAIKQHRDGFADKRNYRPRSTLLKQVDYSTARRIIRENLALIKTIPLLDILKAEQKVLAYFRRKITRDQLARYFYKTGEGAISMDWARMIADDQINKDFERMLVAKWKANGVTMVRWIHDNIDEPRPYHREKWNGKSGIFDGRPNGLNGYVFPIDFPPVIDPKTGERGYPGHMINCRCHLEPVV